MQERDVIAYIAVLALLDKCAVANFQKPDEIAFVRRLQSVQAKALGDIAHSQAHGRTAQEKLIRRSADLMMEAYDTVRKYPALKDTPASDIWMGAVHLTTVLSNVRYRMTIDSAAVMALADYVQSAQALLLKDDGTFLPEFAHVRNISFLFLQFFQSKKCFRAIDIQTFTA